MKIKLKSHKKYNKKNVIKSKRSKKNLIKSKRSKNNKRISKYNNMKGGNYNPEVNVYYDVKSRKEGMTDTTETIPLHVVLHTITNSVQDFTTFNTAYVSGKDSDYDRNKFIEDLIEALLKNKTIENLYLENLVNLSPEQIVPLIITLKDKKSIKYISFHNTKIGDVGAIKLAQILNSMSSSISLNLENCDIGNTGVQALIESFTMIEDKSKMSVNLINNPFLPRLREQLHKLPRMKQLLF
jgi:hypothetical protein